jgi:hypothetical protein
MITATEYTSSLIQIKQAVDTVSNFDFRTTINQPTGNFFYDPWEVKDDFKDTVWGELLTSLHEPVGEARVIVLKPQMSYHIHSDIDDRFHLNINGENCYLIDFDSSKLYNLETNGIWYYMDAGRLHTASNFGRYDRIQLVVRKLLQRNNLKNPTTVRIFSNIPTLDDSRFIFDNTVSPWLNKANKQGIINNFNYTPTCVKFDIEKNYIGKLKDILSDNFRIEEL